MTVTFTPGEVESTFGVDPAAVARAASYKTAASNGQGTSAALPGAMDADVAEELRRLRVRDQAREALLDERSGEVERPAPVNLTALLAQPDDQVRYRVEAMWPAEGRVVLAAPRKAGKTTCMGNLARSLADGDDFLGRYSVRQARVGLLDTEMSTSMLRRWLRDQAMRRPENVEVWPLRGAVSTLDILSARGRARWGAMLRDAGVEVLVLDCLAPALAALDLEETNADVGRFLGALDELLAAGGVGEAIVVHHMGHGPERSRGASRLRDWPEVEWRLVRERDHRDEEVDAGARFLSAYGRDVEVPETRLALDPATRRLTLGEGTRRAFKQTRAMRDVVTAVLVLERNGSAPNVGAVVQHLGRHKDTVRPQLRLAADAGYIETEQAGMSTLHRVTGLGHLFLDETSTGSVGT